MARYIAFNEINYRALKRVFSTVSRSAEKAAYGPFFGYKKGKKRLAFVAIALRMMHVHTRGKLRYGTQV
jgi:hypothetical protein